MFRQQDNRQVYPDVDLHPLPPARNLSSSIMSRSFSSGMALDQYSMTVDALSDSLPVQPTRRGTMAHDMQQGSKKCFRRSFSGGRLDELSTTPVAHASSHLRRQNSANSLRCLARSQVPKRPSLYEQEQQQEEAEAEEAKKKKDRRSRRRTSQESNNRGVHQRRHKSVDVMRNRMEHEEPQDRKVIRSARGAQEFSRPMGRGRSREPATTRREQGIPGSIKIVRGHSCGGRIPCYEADPEPIKIRHPDDEDDVGSYATTSDDSSTSSSIDDFDEGSLGIVFGNTSVHAEKDNRTMVSALTTDMNWRNCDGSIRSTSSPENREALQRSISTAMSSLNSGHLSSLSGTNSAAAPLMQLQSKVMQQMHDSSKRTEPTARMHDCSGSIISEVSHSHAPFQVNMMRPWICLCGEDNDADFNFCGMCAAPQKWTCGSCGFNRNKNRSPHCGGCGLRRAGAAQPMMPNHGANSTRSQRSVPVNMGRY